MNKFVTLVKKEFLESIRTNKVLTLVVILVFIALSSPITAKLLPLILKTIDLQGISITFPDPTYLDAVDQFIKNITQLGIFFVIFLVSGLVADEKVNKTLEILLTKPLLRSQVILAKYVHLFAILAGTYFVAAVTFYLYTISLFTPFNAVNFSIVALMVLLYLLTISSVTIWASTVSKNALGAAGIGLVFMFLVGPIFSLVEMLRPYSPTVIIGEYRNILSSGYTTELLKPIATSLVIIAGSVVASIWFFKKTEIER